MMSATATATASLSAAGLSATATASYPTFFYIGCAHSLLANGARQTCFLALPIGVSESSSIVYFSTSSSFISRNYNFSRN